ncbi:MAG: 3-phosphoshikimate 1-carboxyvinyltransferase, partial [Kiritimatiellae bacterium]|nr:3-phosphoshikimate 1-carboxyvinyltransferase [Kiritimatiellia bacterium]
MRVSIAPSKASGIVTAPPSKSVAHRALICGACSDGVLVTGVAYSVDIDATLSCLAAMG